MSVRFENQEVQLTDVQNPIQNKHGKSHKLKHSNFHITINTNKRHNAESHELIEESQKLKEVADEILSPKVFPQFVIFKQTGDSWTPLVINNVRTKGAIERGDKFDQVHCHLLVCIDHYSMISINTGAMAAFAKERLGFPVYLHIRAKGQVRSPEEIWEDYLNKNKNG
jgi:hypothetical protein